VQREEFVIDLAVRAAPFALSPKSREEGTANREHHEQRPVGIRLAQAIETGLSVFDRPEQ
jgi:hypothetical protein